MIFFILAPSTATKCGQPRVKLDNWVNLHRPTAVVPGQQAAHHVELREHVDDLLPLGDGGGGGGPERGSGSVSGDHGGCHCDVVRGGGGAGGHGALVVAPQVFIIAL